MTKDEVLQQVHSVSGKPVRWATSPLYYEGCDRTLEIFEVSYQESREIRKKLRPFREEFSEALDGPLILIGHMGKMVGLITDVRPLGEQPMVDQQVEIGESKPHRKPI